MTIEEAIAKADKMKMGNQIEEEEKVQWLSELDTKIMYNIINNHEGAEDIPFVGYAYDVTPMNTELLVPEPYSDIYIYYLMMKIDFFNSEIGKYNNDLSQFRASYQDFANYYNRTTMPKQTYIKI